MSTTNQRMKFKVGDLVVKKGFRASSRFRDSSHDKVYEVVTYEGDGYYIVKEKNSLGSYNHPYPQTLSLHARGLQLAPTGTPVPVVSTTLENRSKSMSGPALPKFAKKWPKIVGIRPPTQQHTTNLSILRVCAQTGANVPAETREYFKCPIKVAMSEFEYYSKNGLETEIPMSAFVTEKGEGYTIDLSRLPQGIGTLRAVFNYEEGEKDGVREEITKGAVPTNSVPIPASTPSSQPPVDAGLPTTQPVIVPLPIAQAPLAQPLSPISPIIAVQPPITVVQPLFTQSQSFEPFSILPF